MFHALNIDVVCLTDQLLLLEVFLSHEILPFYYTIFGTHLSKFPSSLSINWKIENSLPEAKWRKMTEE